MEILTADESKDLHPLGSGRFSELYKKLILIEMGQTILIRHADWKVKITPYGTIRKVEKTYARKFEYGRHPDGDGWMVKRVG